MAMDKRHMEILDRLEKLEAELAKLTKAVNGLAATKVAESKTEAAEKKTPKK
jgi:hypothetical protein